MSAFSLTFYFAQRPTVKLGKNFFGVKDIKEARQRLDRLLQEQAATTAAQIHDIAHGHAEIMKSMDSEQRHPVSSSQSIEYPSF